MSGKNLGDQKDLEVSIGEVRIPLSINPDGSAEFTMPEGVSPGIGDIKLISKTLGDLGQATMLADPGDYPISTMAVDEVCKDKKFRNAKGEIIVGTKDCGSMPLCSASVQVDCRLTSEFLSVPKTELIPNVIKSGAKVGGVTGTYPSATNLLTGADATADLDSASFAAKIKSGGSFEFFGPDGTRYTFSGDPDLTAANILSGVEIFGTTGTMAGAPAACTANNISGCITTASYKSADWTNLTAANIKNGASVAGLTGTYPSTGNLLTGADGTADLDTATFDAKIKSSSSFEFFGPNGTRYTNTGDADITAANISTGVTIFGTTGTATVLTQCTSGVQATCESDTACRWNAGACEINPWHIRAGITVASKAGSLKANCRNTINSTYYNWDGSVGSLPNTAQTGGSAYDFWDTIDDSYGFAPNKVTAWSSDTQCDSSNWTDVTTTNGGSSFTTCGTSSTCIRPPRDRSSGLFYQA